MAAVILVNYKIFTLHRAMNIICVCTCMLWHMGNAMEPFIIVNKSYTTDLFQVHKMATRLILFVILKPDGFSGGHQRGLN